MCGRKDRPGANVEIAFFDPDIGGFKWLVEDVEQPD
jgi:hypothetical protein